MRRERSGVRAGSTGLRFVLMMLVAAGFATAPALSAEADPKGNGVVDEVNDTVDDVTGGGDESDDGDDDDGLADDVGDVVDDVGGELPGTEPTDAPVETNLQDDGDASKQGGPPWRFQPCGGKSWVGGATNVCRGVLTYRDYIYDDYGEDTGNPTAPTIGDLSRPAGDERYDEGEENTADLVELKLWIEGDELKLKAELNTLYEDDQTILAVAIDTDDDRSTGGGKWGNLDVSSDGWDEIHFFDEGDAKKNLIKGTIPLPDGERWRVQAVTAIAETDNVMNVAFRGIDEEARFSAPALHKGAWFEDRQAEALAKGDITEFAADVRVEDLRERRTRRQRITPGLRERVYTSRYTLESGEGLTYGKGIPGRGDGGSDEFKPGFEQHFHYFGRYQPYGIYIPDGQRPYGLQMVFHGTDATITSVINQTGMQRQFGEHLNRLLVTPLHRGPDGWGSDISERDILDVMADVRRHYPVDGQRVFSSGHSQGGYIAYRMAMFFPHVFAGAISWVGFTGDEANGAPPGSPHYFGGAVGNAYEFVANLHDIPTAMLYAAEDELMHVWTAVAMEEQFRANESPYVWYMHPVAEHLTLGVLDDWEKEAEYTEDLERIRRPTRVRYRYDTIVDSPDYRIRHDRAYWIWRIRVRDDDEVGELDLTNRTCGERWRTTVVGSGAGPRPVPWTSRFRGHDGTGEVERKPSIKGTLTNIKSLTIDVGETCLEHRRFKYELTTDGPTTIRLTDGRELDFHDGGTHRGSLGEREGS